MHRKTGNTRAVKVIKTENLNKKQLVRLQTEIDVLKDLDHPNILRLYETFKDDKRHYLVTELCSGVELFNEIRKRYTMPEKDAAMILHQVLSAVAYCHSKSICHRDLKPENIILDV